MLLSSLEKCKCALPCPGVPAISTGQLDQNRAIEKYGETKEKHPAAVVAILWTFPLRWRLVVY